MKRRTPVVTLLLAVLVLAGTYSQNVSANETNYRTIAAANGNGVCNTGDGNMGNDTTNGNANGGTSGTDGPNGSNGSNGSNGNNGNNGNDGNNGSNCNNGNNGDNGDNGQDDNNIWEVKLFPIIFGDYDVYKKVINLTGTTADKDSFGDRCAAHTRIDNVAYTPYDVRKLQLDKYGEGFMVERSMKYEIGLGVGAGITNQAYPGLGFSLGVAAVKNGMTKFVKYADDLQKVDQLSYKIPYRVEQAQDMKVGESVEYTAEGGIVFGGGVGYWPVGAGAKYMVTGGWRYYVEKVGCDTVELRVLKSKIKSGGVYVGTVFSHVSANKLEDAATGFTYRIYLGDASAVFAYEGAMNGDLQQLQKLAADPLDSSVQKIQNNEIRLTGKNKKFQFGFPFLFNRSETGRYLELTNTDLLEEDVRQESTYGIYVKEKTARAITKHKKRSQLFYGGVATLQDRFRGTATQDYSGTFQYAYENDWAKSWKLRSAISEVAELTGLEAYTYAQVSGSSQTDLEYAEVKTDVQFPKAYFDKLMKVNRSRNGLVSFRKSAQDELEKYIANGKDPYGLCYKEGSTLDRSEKARCKSAYIRRIKKSFDNIATALHLMADTVAKDKKAFAKAIASFGEHTWDNRFTFKAMVNQGQECGVSIAHNVGGKRVSFMKKFFEFPVKASCK